MSFNHPATEMSKSGKVVKTRPYTAWSGIIYRVNGRGSFANREAYAGIEVFKAEKNNPQGQKILRIIFDFNLLNDIVI